MSIKSLLETEIENEFKELEKMQLGTEDYDKTVNGLTRLIDRSLEIDKFKHERCEQIETREREYELKHKELENERVDRWIKNGLTALGIVTSIGLAVWGTNKSLKFEETGTVTTMIGRGFISKLLPKK